MQLVQKALLTACKVAENTPERLSTLKSGPPYRHKPHFISAGRTNFFLSTDKVSLLLLELLQLITKLTIFFYGQAHFQTFYYFRNFRLRPIHCSLSSQQRIWLDFYPLVNETSALDQPHKAWEFTTIKYYNEVTATVRRIDASHSSPLQTRHTYLIRDSPETCYWHFSRYLISRSLHLQNLLFGTQSLSWHVQPVAILEHTKSFHDMHTASNASQEPENFVDWYK